LPEDLSEKQFARFKDPQTKEPYEYSVLGEKNYELCATFDLADDEAEKNFYYNAEEVWAFHDAGRQCYQRKITAEDLDDPYLRPVPLKDID